MDIQVSSTYSKWISFMSKNSSKNVVENGIFQSCFLTKRKNNYNSTVQSPISSWFYKLIGIKN